MLYKPVEYPPRPPMDATAERERLEAWLRDLQKGAKMRDRNETIYRLTVEDIFLTAESNGRDESELTPEVVEKVIHKIEAMDFSDISNTIDMFTEEAIDEIEEARAPAPEPAS